MEEQKKADHTEETLAAEKRVKKGKEHVAMLYSSSMVQAAHTIAALTDHQTDALHVLIGMKKEILEEEKGGKDITERMLVANAFTLDALFSHMARFGAVAYDPADALPYMDVALRAQDQLRKVALALDQIRRPKQQIMQTNIAAVQQVNNGQVLTPTCPNISKIENELVSEATYETLDQRGTSDTITAGPRVEAMAELYRTEDSGG